MTQDVLADDLIRRLSDEPTLEAAILEAPKQSRHGWGWFGPSLASGEAGLSLVHSAAARRTRSVDGIDHAAEAIRLVRVAAGATRRVPIDGPGLLGGTAGLAHAVRSAAMVEPRLNASRDALDRQLAEQVLGCAPPRPEALVVEDFDVISGLAGVVLYLAGSRPVQNSVRSCIVACAESLVAMVGDDRSSLVAGMTIRPDQYPLKSYEVDFPNGYINVGLAHGLPGVLMALAAVERLGFPVRGLSAAREQCVAFLLGSAVNGAWGTGVPVTAEGALGPTADSDRCHVAWCYGGPGVCMALLLAAEVTRDAGLERFARDSFAKALRNYRDRGGAISPTFCHGHAGMLVAARRFAQGDELLDREVLELKAGLSRYYEPDSLLGVRDQELPGSWVDDPSFLTGSAGVALALLDEDLQRFRPLVGADGDI